MTLSDPAHAGPSIIDAAAGEEPFGFERLVLAPAPGRFVALEPEVRPRPGDVVLAGQPIGVVLRSREELVVRTPFSGVVAGMIALDGERLTLHQPVAWLRVGDAR